MITTVKEIMTEKLVTISPENSVRKAIGLMEHYKINCLPVIENNQLVGLITSRDVRLNHPNRLVADAMSRNVITIPLNCTLWEAEKLLNQYKIEHLVVIENNKPAGVITKTQLYIELGKYTDSLTGLNTADFLRYKALELLQKENEICIIFLDLDKFGEINKRFGHIIGDKILCGVAQILINSIDAKTDYLCRYAGDEFSILTTEPFNSAVKLTDQISNALKAENWPNKIKITLSSGIAGGQRNTCRNKNLIKVVNNLINTASLASTKAKLEKVTS
ncbi:MAG TPA: diguanylate cyclase [Firmicutes bacterium]|jgi:IMP dehydrogenase|nr:diguanylate cyclase [Bacillota bacterium]